MTVLSQMYPVTRQIAVPHVPDPVMDPVFLKKVLKNGQSPAETEAARRRRRHRMDSLPPVPAPVMAAAKPAKPLPNAALPEKPGIDDSL